MVNDYSKYTKEVEDKLYKLASNIKPEQKEKLKKYIGTQLDVYALTSKTQTEAFKKGYSFYKGDLEQIFDTFHSIHHTSNNFETKNQAYLFLDKYFNKVDDAKIYAHLITWVKQIDNWAHSDNLSKYLTRFSEKPELKNKFLSQLEKWNKSKNPWERRQSLISLFYYARTKKNHVEFDLAQKHLLNLIDDSDYFVQKAVGWTLRESYNVYPDLTYKLIKNNIKNITSIAFTTSVEKMTLQEKNTLKQLRK